MNAKTRRKLEMGSRALEFSRAHLDESSGYQAAIAQLEEQLQRSTDALQEIHLVPLGGFEVRPRDPTNLSHRGKPIVQLREIAVGFPRIAPGPVNTYAAFAGRVLTGDVVLVVGAGGLR